MAFVFPDAILHQHMAVLGKTGSGKSSVLRLLVEHLLADKKPVCVIDPKGDWWGLKSSKDGKRPGFPVVIFGGEHADVPLNAHGGAAVAELIVSGNRPCIIDLGGWMVGERTRFFIDFASTMFRKTSGYRCLVIDEVHNFAPQGKVLDPDAGKMLHWANRLASEGRGKGLAILSASQRPQKVHKDFLTCAETLIAMRVIHPLDRAAIKDWVDGCADPQVGRDVIASLASMQRGEGWAWSPESNFGPKRVQFPKFDTYDSFAPKAAAGTLSLKGWAAVDLEEVKAKLVATIEEAKANDPAELKKTIVELRKQLAAKPAATVDQASIDRAVAARDREWQAAIKERDTIIGSLKGRMGKAADLLHVNGEAMPKQAAPVAKAADIPVHKTSTIRETSPQRPAKQTAPTSTVGGSPLSKAERAILVAFYWLKDEEATPAKVSFYSGYSATSSSFGNACSGLRTAGLVQGWKITVAGCDFIADVVDEKPTGGTLREWLRGRLGRAENTLLDALLNHHPHRLTSSELSEASGYSATSSSFGNAVSKLRTIEAAEGYERDGGIKASDILVD